MRDSWERLIADLEAAGAASRRENVPCAYFGAGPRKCVQEPSGRRCPAFEDSEPCAAIMARDAAERAKAILTGGAAR